MGTVLYDYHLDLHHVKYDIVFFITGAVLLTAAIILFVKLKRKTHIKFICIIVMFFISAPMLSIPDLSIAQAVADHITIRNNIKNGAFDTVTGYVEDLREIDEDGIITLNFKIDDIKFRIIGYPGQTGYDTLPSMGGVIYKNGQYLTISYIKIYRPEFPHTHYFGEGEFTTVIIKVLSVDP